MEYKVQSWFSKEFIFYVFKVAGQGFVLSHLNLSAQNAVSLETKSNMNLKIPNRGKKQQQTLQIWPGFFNPVFSIVSGLQFP